MKKVITSAMLCLFLFAAHIASAQCTNDSVGIMNFSIQNGDLIQQGFTLNVDAPATSISQLRIGKLWNYRQKPWADLGQFVSVAGCNVTLLVNHTQLASLRYFDVVQFRVILIPPYNAADTSRISTFVYLPCSQRPQARQQQGALVQIDSEYDAGIPLMEVVSHVDAIHITGAEAATSLDLSSLRVITGSDADDQVASNPADNIAFAKESPREVRIDNPDNVPFALTVMDITGKIVARDHVDGQTFHFSAGNISGGVYLFDMIFDDGYRKVQKVVIE